MAKILVRLAFGSGRSWERQHNSFSLSGKQHRETKDRRRVKETSRGAVNKKGLHA